MSMKDLFSSLTEQQRRQLENLGAREDTRFGQGYWVRLSESEALLWVRRRLIGESERQE